MPLQRLRRVLEAQYRVKVESSNELIRKVNRKRANRQADLQAKLAPIPPSKNATLVASLAGRNDWNIRAIDLLHKIGFLTTPASVNMAKLSSSWATRRYFWAIAEPGQNQLPQIPNFRLSADARQMDFHQKTLLSDEFGIGMAGLLIEQFFQADSFIDISAALDDPIAFQNIVQQGDAQPDYLMWGDQANSPYYVVECKGSQSDRNTSYDQLRRGLEQVPTIIIAPGARQVVTVIIATCMLENETEVLVLDPPPSSPDDPVEKEQSRQRSTQRKERTWSVRDPELFHRRAMIAEDSNLLKWAGQYRTASGRDAQLRGLVPAEIVPDDAALEIKRTNFGVFLGTEHLLFPELGRRDLRIFTGVEQALLESLIRQPKHLDVAQHQIEHQPRFDRIARERLPANISINGDGGCMIVEGV